MVGDVDLNFVKKKLNSMDKELQDLKNFRSVAIKNIKDDVDNLLNSGDFYSGFKKYMLKVISDEVKVQIRNQKIMDDLKEVTRFQVERTIKNNFRELIKEVVRVTVDSQLKKYTYELNRAKELAYSTDAVIRHTVRDMPISYSFEQKIIKKLDVAIKNLSDKYLLSDKKKLLED